LEQFDSQRKTRRYNQVIEDIVAKEENLKSGEFQQMKMKLELVEEQNKLLAL